MNVLVIGCGSIGSRHAINIHKLGHQVYVCDPNDIVISKLQCLIPLHGIYRTCDEALNDGLIDASVIAAPTNLHHSLALKLITANIPLFVEKPLASNLSEASEISLMLESNPVTFLMGHTYRFRKDWQELKSLLMSQSLGKIFSAEMSGGWYLPDWHFREDYWDGYAAQRQKGGGVILTSMSHLFDLIAWLFGDIDQLIGMKSKLSDLEIDVEDCVSVILKTNSQCMVTVYEDFLSRFPRRFIRVTCEHGFIEVDFNKHKIVMWDERESRFLPSNMLQFKSKDAVRILEDGIIYSLPNSFDFFADTQNSPYLDIMRHFISLVENKCLFHDLDVKAGINVMKCIDLLSS